MFPVETGCGSSGDTASPFQQMIPSSMFNEPESELTFNLPGSRKRARDAQPLLAPLSSSALFQQQKQQLLLQKQLLLLRQIQRKMLPSDKAIENGWVNQSAVTSTSVRPRPLMTADPYSSLDSKENAGSDSSSGLISVRPYPSLEVGSVVRLHRDQMLLGIKESCKHHCGAVVAVVENQAQKRFMEKQAELDAAVKRKAELEERLRQATAESQAWFNVARTSEASITSLRTRLEQALLNCAAGIDLSGTTAAEGEGYGDSDEAAVTSAAATASGAVSRSVCRIKAPTITDGPHLSVGTGSSLACRSCAKLNACVLLLPCRHLCLCQSCEPYVDDCPVCRSKKNASLRINL